MIIKWSYGSAYSLTLSRTQSQRKRERAQFECGDPLATQTLNKGLHPVTHEQYAYWLAGIFDGEGSVSFNPDHSERRVSISNTDPVLIRRITEALDVLGIGYTVYVVQRQKPHHKDSLTVKVSGRANLILFFNWVPFQAPAKTRKLYEALTTFKRASSDELPLFTSPDAT